MNKLTTALTGTQPLLLALGVLGCATAACITGHISGTDFLAVAGVVGGGAGIVTTAHVVGTQVNTAAGASPTTATTPTSGVV